MLDGGCTLENTIIPAPWKRKKVLSLISLPHGPTEEMRFLLIHWCEMSDASSHWISLREQCCSSRNSTGFPLTDRLEIGSWQKVIYPVQNYRWEGIQGREAEKRWLSTQGSLGYKEGAASEEAGVQKLGWKQSPTTWRYQLGTVNLSSLVANVSYLIEKSHLWVLQWHIASLAHIWSLTLRSPSSIISSSILNPK